MHKKKKRQGFCQSIFCPVTRHGFRFFICYVDFKLYLLCPEHPIEKRIHVYTKIGNFIRWIPTAVFHLKNHIVITKVKN